MNAMVKWVLVWVVIGAMGTGRVCGQGKDSGPMTELLKGILEVDPNKKFDLSKARITNSATGIKEQRVFEAKELEAKRFEGLRSFFARKATEVSMVGVGPEFAGKQVPVSRYADVRKFDTKTLPDVMSDANGRRFEVVGAMESPFNGRKADASRFSRSVPAGRAREAERVDQPEKPGALKSWSASSGRVLSVDEVREILNRSK